MFISVPRAPADTMCRAWVGRALSRWSRTELNRCPQGVEAPPTRVLHSSKITRLFFVFQCACARVLPGLTYDCRANDRDVQGDKAIPLPKEEIQNGNPDAQPDTAGYQPALTQQSNRFQPVDGSAADCEKHEQCPQRKQECHF